MSDHPQRPNQNPNQLQTYFSNLRLGTPQSNYFGVGAPQQQPPAVPLVPFVPPTTSWSALATNASLGPSSGSSSRSNPRPLNISDQPRLDANTAQWQGVGFQQRPPTQQPARPALISATLGPPVVVYAGSADPQAALDDLKRRYSADQLIRAKNGLTLPPAAMRTIQAHPGYQHLDGFKLKIPTFNRRRGRLQHTEFKVTMQILGRFVSSREYYTLTDGTIWSMSELRKKLQDALSNRLAASEALKLKLKDAVQDLLTHQKNIQHGR